ncbi:MAG TPA: hypothetical protein DCE52_15375 [Rhodobacteraceae bacterium]|nr:hypothetical protein [Paracoccaceae bacterium]
MLMLPDLLQTTTQIATFKAGDKRKTLHQHLFLPKDYSGSPTVSLYTPWTEAEVLSHLTAGWGARPKYYELGAVDADGDGRFDLIASERGGDLLETRVYLNNGENKFDRKNSVIIPQVKTHPDVVDVFAHNGVTYILRSAGGSYWNNSTEYGEIIQRHNITTKENTIIYENKCSKSTNNCGAVFGKLHLLTDRSGKKFLVGENTSYTKFGERVRIK